MVGVVLVAGLLLPLSTGTAAAHDNVLLGSDPAPSATLSSPPARITLSFRWRIKPGSTSVTVLGPDGVSQWQLSKLDELDRTVGIGLRQLGPAGRDAVHYRGRSMRDQPFQGTMEFVLAEPGGSPRDHLPLAWIASVVLLTTAATAFGVRLGRTGL